MGYIINKFTIALLTEYDSYGNEHTLVHEGAKVFLVEQTPNEIVEASFNYLGNGLEGAMKGARGILKKKKMVPVAFHIPHGIILFSCKLPQNLGIVWFNNSGIYTAEAVNKKRTRVYLVNGKSVVVEMSYPVFQQKRQQSSFLYTTIHERYPLETIPLYSFQRIGELQKIAEDKTKYRVTTNDHEDEE